MKEEIKRRFLELCKEDGFDISDPLNPQYSAVMNNVNIIPAGAGSGKTAVLSHRFLRLVLDGMHCDEILTITFTRDATANMKGKIFKILSSAKDKGLIEQDELDRFSKATISTTDSFCSQIVREDCVRYGISSTFSIDDDDNLKKESARIIRRIIEDRKGDAEMKHYLSMMSVSNIEETFIKIASDYCSIANPPSQNYKAVECNILKDLRFETIDTDLDGLTQHARNYFDSLKEKDYDEGSFGAKNKELLDDFLSCNDKKAFLSDNDSCLGGNVGKKELRQKCVNLWQDLVLRCRATSEKNLKLLKYLFGLIAEFDDQLLKYKRESGLLTFHDVMQLSIDILKTNKTIRDRYRKKFKAVMVDEFQDNNDDNRILVYLLATNDNYSGGYAPSLDEIDINKVFMVGDEKQSIYRFRNADVTVFKKMIADFGKDRTVTLRKNFRSEQAIINCINALFKGKIIPETSDCDYEAVYESLEPVKNALSSPQIEFHYLEPTKGAKEESPKDVEIEAFDVAATIKKMVKGEEKEYYIYDGKSKKIRPPKYSDIAILLKTYTNQRAFEKALKAYGIPYESPENKSLTLDSLANDFCSLLQLAVYGETDTASLLAFLKSPLCSLTDADLVALKKNEKGSSEKMGFARSMIDRVSANLAHEGIADTIRFIWEDLGYRFVALKGNGENTFAEEHYNYLFSLAVDYDTDGKSIVQFLSKLREFYGKENGIKDITVQREQETGVKIMSIYKSKGLEFPIVFVSDMGCSTSGKGGFSPNVSFNDGNVILPYFIPAGEKALRNPYVISEKDDKTLKDNAETKRVLYVAATRAMQHLVFTGVLPNTFDEVGTETHQSMMNYFLGALGCKKEKEKAPVFGSDIPIRQHYSIIPPEKKIESNGLNTQNQSECSLIESWYRNPQSAFSFEKTKVGVTTLVHGNYDKETHTGYNRLPSIPCDDILTQIKSGEIPEDEEERPADVEEGENSSIAAFGSLVHSTLENAVLGVDDKDDFGKFFNHPQKKLIRESAEMLRDNFLSSEFRKSLEGYELYPEKEFYTFDETSGLFVEGIIDLLCIKDGNAIIIDYKTDHYRQPEDHRKQLEYYKKTVESIYPGYKVSAFLFYLRSGEAVQAC